MLLTIIQNLWILLLLFIFVFLPAIFVFGFFSTKSTAKEEASLPEPKEFVERVTPEIYRTVKKEPGSYEVRGPNNSIAIVIKVEYPNEGTYWVASHAAKNGKMAERVKTKKEAVEAAIELLKDANNGK